MKSLLRYARPLGIAAAVAIAFGACDEQLNGGAACPALCPTEPGELRDTTFFAVELDTTISGFPILGEETQFFLAAKGDSLQTAMVIRWDSLPHTFRRVNVAEDSVIYAVDSAFIQIKIIAGDTLDDAPTTIDFYDVDFGDAADADPAMVKDSLIPSRLFGSHTISADSLRDSLVFIPVDNAALLAKIQKEDSTERRLRLAFRVREGSAGTQLIVKSMNGGGDHQLIFRPAIDTSVPKEILVPRSRRPENDVTGVAIALTDYQVTVKAPPDPPADVFRLGGTPANRAYLRFNIPSRILDSSAVMRATLELTQRPAGLSSNSRDTVRVGHFGILSSGAITDLARALQFVTPPPATRPDTVRFAPADSALREFQIIDWVRVWRGTSPTRTPRAIALSIESEGLTGTVIDFFSIEAPPDVRPRLRLIYLPRPEASIP